MNLICNSCNIEKSEDLFPIRSNTNDIITYRDSCKECYNEERRLKWKSQKEQKPKVFVSDLPEEIWKEIEGWESLYLISNKGRVKSIIGRYGFEKLLKPIKKRGYLSVNLSYNGRLNQEGIHVLVAYAFIENPLNKPEVNHINGDKEDNTVDNLEWVTKSENQLHAVRTGLRKVLKGEKHPFCKLTDATVRAIFISSLSVRDLSVKYHISKSHIRDIKSKKYRADAIID
jgi:hypothetical protein